MLSKSFVKKRTERSGIDLHKPNPVYVNILRCVDRYKLTVQYACCIFVLQYQYMIYCNYIDAVSKTVCLQAHAGV